ncbi:MAG: hypothetical protein AB2693_29695, partial [Candidatus Thiodiazotropha sp.]
EGKEGLLTWYRNILISRLRGAYDNEIFQNVAVTRKNTARSSSSYKYAKDCYALSLFLRGDMTAQIEEIFPARGSKPSISETGSSQHIEQTPNRVETACTKQLIQSLRMEINEIKKTHAESLKRLGATIDSLEQENLTLTNKLHRIESEFNAKVTQYDSKLKQMSTSLKDIEYLNAHEINTRFLNLEISNKRLSNTVNRIRTNMIKSPVSHEVRLTSDEPNQIKAPEILSTTDNTTECQSHTPRRDMIETDSGGKTKLGNDILKHVALESESDQRNSAVNGDQSRIQRTLDHTSMELYSTDSVSRTNTPTSHSLYKATQAKNRISVDNGSKLTAPAVTTKQNVNYTALPTNLNYGTAATRICNDNVQTRTVPTMVPPVPGMVPTAPLYIPNGTLTGNNQPYIPFDGAPTRHPMNNIFNPTTANYIRAPNNLVQQPIWPTLQSAPVPAQGQQSCDAYNASTKNQESRANNQASHMDSDGGSLQHVGSENTSFPNRINKETNINTQNSDEVFIGVHRRRLQKYFVSNIDERSTRKGILMHFEQNGVEVHELNLFRGRNNKCYAQVIVETKYKEKVESDSFDWPDGIFCTYWRASKNKQKDRRNR